MRFTDTKESGEGKTVYQFWVGQDELRLVYACLAKAHLQIPDMLETQQLRQRLGDMTNKIKKVADEHGVILKTSQRAYQKKRQERAVKDITESILTP